MHKYLAQTQAMSLPHAGTYTHVLTRMCTHTHTHVNTQTDTHTDANTERNTELTQMSLLGHGSA